MSYPIDQVSIGDTITFTSEHQQNAVFNGISAEVVEKEKTSTGNYHLVVEVTENNGVKVRKTIHPIQIIDNLTHAFAERSTKNS